MLNVERLCKNRAKLIGYIKSV